jgi:hypothetical protein
MSFRRALLLASVLACAAAPVRAQSTAADGVSTLLRRFEAVLRSADTTAFPSLFSNVSDGQVQQWGAQLFVPGAVRSIVRERDRRDLEGAPPGDGYRVVFEVFVETPGRARILTASVDIRRPPNGDTQSWRIVRTESLSSIEGLFRLRLDSSKQYMAHDLEIRSEDLLITLPSGSVFEVASDDGVTGVVLLGRGEMKFSPTPEAERGQLKLFSGADTLNATFDAVFVRLNPSDYSRVVSRASLVDGPPDARMVKRAQDVFSREAPKSFVLDLSDFSQDTWHLLPQAGDLLAEVQSRRYGSLTFSRSNQQAEDVQLFQRDKKRTIALYASQAKVAARGRFYSEDLLREFDILDYNIDASVDPSRQMIDARARLAIRARASLSTLTLRLADSLEVSGVTSVEFGRLVHLRLSGQNTLMVSLPRTLTQDADLTLVISYSGRLAPEVFDTEALQVGQDAPSPPDLPVTGVEPNYLLSNRSMWYPQNPVPDYATASLRITVPEAFGCVATGEPSRDAVVSLRDLLTLPNGKAYSFRANQPIRYLALIVSRLDRVGEKTIAVSDEDARDPRGPRVKIAVEANPRQRGRGRTLLGRVEEVMRFYSGLMGDAPYPSMTIAFVESELPGGHSPAYFAMLNEPLPSSAIQWRNDPAAFEGFPEFFLAHELAHQWWGQAVGWKNYHEQWLSEGFAQYFAALFAQRTRGDRVFVDMLRQFRKWSISESDQGPISLGYRLGHIKGDVRVFRAVVYNKGAAVLHMLRRLVGDEVFFRALRRFYQDRKFQKAGTDDLQRAFEQESGRDLDRFFDRWIFGTDLPRITYHATIDDRSVTMQFEQQTSEVFDVPVTVTLVYTDGRTKDVVVPVTGKRIEQRIETDGAVRQVQVNRDSGALGEFEEVSSANRRASLAVNRHNLGLDVVPGFQHEREVRSGVFIDARDALVRAVPFQTVRTDLRQGAQTFENLRRPVAKTKHLTIRQRQQRYSNGTRRDGRRRVRRRGFIGDHRGHRPDLASLAH